MKRLLKGMARLIGSPMATAIASAALNAAVEALATEGNADPRHVAAAAAAGALIGVANHLRQPPRRTK